MTGGRVEQTAAARARYAGLLADHLRHAAGPVRARDEVRNSGMAGSTVGALPILQTPYPVGRGGEASHEALGAYVDVIRDLADATGAPLVDHFRHWAGLEQRWDWYHDPWHVDDRGHRELAQFMISSLLSDGYSVRGAAYASSRLAADRVRTVYAAPTTRGILPP